MTKKKKKYIILWHGTESKTFKKILKTGLRKGSSLTSSERVAYGHANFGRFCLDETKKSKQNKSVIITYRIPLEYVKFLNRDEWEWINKKTIPNKFIKKLIIKKYL